MDVEEIFESFDIDVSEMTTDPGGMVPLSPALVAEITDGDDDPRFATFVIESGWSKSKRFWGSELFSEVASEIQNASTTEPIVGYLGHIRPEDDPYTFPEIQLQWAGAKLLQTGDKAKLAVKAYVLPGTKGRDYLKRKIAKTVSWRGKAALEPFQKGVRVAKFNIESIDLSRPRAAGMSARMVGALTSEMEERSDTVKPEEIAALQQNELRAHNPSLVEAIEKDARSPLETKVGEMETAAKAAEPIVSLVPQLREILGLKDDVDEVGVIQAAITKIKSEAKSLREGILDKVLEKRFKGGSDADKSLVRRILVGEMADRDVKITGNSEEDEKAVSEMVTTIIDGDDALKTTVSEMEGAPADLPTTQKPDGSGKSEWKPGMSTTNVRVKARV
jgi:hypothetical protein